MCLGDFQAWSPLNFLLTKVNAVVRRQAGRERKEMTKWQVLVRMPRLLSFVLCSVLKLFRSDLSLKNRGWWLLFP